MRGIVRKLGLLAGLGLALTAIVPVPRAAAQGTGAPGATSAPKGNTTPFPGGAAAPKSAGPANPGPTGPARVAVVNIQEAITNTQEGAKEFAALKAKFDPQEAQLKSLNDDLEKLRAELKASTNISASDRASKQKTIDQRTTEFQGLYDTAQRSFQQAEGEVVNRLGKKMMDVLTTYSKAHAIDMVVDVGNPQTPVLWAADKLNITRALVEAYDKQFPLKQ